ncbi:MAG: T9SS type A sorting domain-containing protein, partial [Cytophagaceae bacterium]
VDSTAQWTGNMTGQCTEVFLQRVFIDLNRGEWLMWANSNKLVIANSIITQGLTSNSGYRGPLQLNRCANFVISGNSFTYAVDGLNLNDAHDGVFENNRVYRDGAARYPASVINHVLILNFAENVAVLANEFKVINGPAQNSNDGETIIAEGGGPDRIDEDAGIMSGATSITITDNTKNWANVRRRPVVAIVNGKGVGQWRTITSRTANRLTIDRPWDVVPAVGSHYAIFNWGARNWLLQGNTMEGNRRGITLYHNATNQVAIINNTLINNGSIDLAPIQQEHVGVSLSQQFIPMYNNQIIGNLVSNMNGENGVFIGVHSVQFMQEKTFGTSVIGLEVRDNTLTAGQPNIPAIVDANFPEGYLNYLQYQPGVNRYVEEQIPAILGSIFQNNTAINCDHALHLNSGSYNTLVCNLKLKNSTILLKDDRLDRVSHASIRTTSCLTDISAGLPPVVAIYPNPATNELHIEMSEAGAHFKIYSVLGILLLESDIAGSEADIDIQHLPVGSYLLVVQFKEGNQTSQHFIKQRS